MCISLVYIPTESCNTNSGDEMPEKLSLSLFVVSYALSSRICNCHMQNSRKKKFWVAKACLVLGSTSMQLKTLILIYIFKNTLYFNLKKINKYNIVKHRKRITSIKFWKLFFIHVVGEGEFFSESSEKQNSLKAFKN